MNAESLTTDQLKAMCYDWLMEIDRLKANIQIANNELNKRRENEAKETKATPKTTKDK